MPELIRAVRLAATDLSQLRKRDVSDAFARFDVLVKV
jgi:hypothetical protein